MDRSRAYSFAGRMKMSDGFSATADVKEILMENIPGAVGVTRAAKENDMLGVDWWVEMSSTRHLAVDAKVRETDWAAQHPEEDDLALETWSVVESKKIGWTRDQSKRCDYILWLWKDSGRFCLIPFPMLCKIFTGKMYEWKSKYKTSTQLTPNSTGGYHSECVFVPRKELWREIYRVYGGERGLA